MALFDAFGGCHFKRSAGCACRPCGSPAFGRRAAAIHTPRTSIRRIVDARLDPPDYPCFDPLFRSRLPAKHAMEKNLRHLTIDSLLASPFVTAVVLVSLLSFAAVVFGPG
ncbi:MAG: hypothetical protein ABIR94_20110 [Rubrivivax sp.]